MKNSLVPQLPEFDTWQSIRPLITEPESEWDWDWVAIGCAVAVIIGCIASKPDPYAISVSVIGLGLAFAIARWLQLNRRDSRDAVLCHVALSDTGKRLLGQADGLLAKWSDHRRDVRCYRFMKRRLGVEATASVRTELMARGKALEAEAWEIRNAQENLKVIFRRQLAAEKMKAAPG